MSASKDTPLPTPEGGWPAQPALTPRETFADRARRDLVTLQAIAEALDNPKQLRRVDAREALRRQLAGIVAHCETTRMALEKGRIG